MNINRNTDYSPSNIHKELSDSINAFAIIPPRVEKNELDLLDVVIISQLRGSVEKIQCTGVSLKPFLSHDKHTAFECSSNITEAGFIDKCFSEEGKWNEEVERDVNFILRKEKGLEAKSSDIFIVDEEIEEISERCLPILKHDVYTSCKEIVSSINKSVHPDDEFVFGVVYKIVKASIDALCDDVTEDIASKSIGYYSDDENGNQSYEISLFPRGVIGVCLICFVVQIESDNSTFRISAPFRFGKNISLNKAHLKTPLKWYTLY